MSRPNPFDDADYPYRHQQHHERPHSNMNTPTKPLPVFATDSPTRKAYRNSLTSDQHFNGFPQVEEPMMHSPSAAAVRYSPNAFGRRNLQPQPLPFMNDGYQSPLRASPLRASPYVSQEPMSERKLFTELESPSRKKHASVIFDNDEDDEEDAAVNYQFHGSPTRGSPTRMAHPFAEQQQIPQFHYDTNNNNIHSRNPSGGSTVNSLESEGKAFNEKLQLSSSNFSGETYDTNFYKQYSGNADDSFDSDGMYGSDSDSEESAPRRRNSTTKRKSYSETSNSSNSNTVNFSLDNIVPKKLLSILPQTNSKEFTHMRYSACTSEPDDFIAEGFTLRANKLDREIELCVCITMYNESEVDFTRTMHAVMKNVAYLCSRKKSRVWGPDGWKKVQIIIVSDGRSKINNNVCDVLTAMGVYQKEIARSSVNSKDVKAHLFEYTTQVSINEELQYEGAEKGIVPVQVLFCLKENNQKKINSHRWLFNAFCKSLDPNVVVLLDVGTKPNIPAFYHMWKAFDRDSNVAGVAGEIKALKGKGCNKLLNPLVASQNFEYKMSNILDKPLESVFGYISVLPGALSAYRYKALLNHEDGTGPLNSYFKGESAMAGPARDVFSANMYLAEDRILCWELVAKRNASWVLKYVKEATGETDLPETVPEFISQRRRWLNGALFAAIFSQIHFRQIWNTNHSAMRKICFHIEFFYQFIQLLFSWFSIGNFYLTFYFLAGSLRNSARFGTTGGTALFTIFNYITIATMCALFIISMGNRPQGAQHLFILCMVLLSIASTFALICGLYFAFNQLSSGSEGHRVFVNIVVSLLSTFGLYTFTSIIYLDPWHMITSSVQYFLLLPSYTCTLQIFAFCNTHDVSWGTKGDNKPESKDLGSVVATKDAHGEAKFNINPFERMNIDSAFESAQRNMQKQHSTNLSKQAPVKTVVSSDDYYRDIRTRVVLLWLISNLILIMSMTQVYGTSNTGSNKYLVFILWSVAFLSLFRACGSVMYLVLKYTRFLVISNKKIQRKSESQNWSLNPLKWFNKSSISTSRN
ncbi:hypothetical protein WICPIJ_003268 [Wickerhamomyces pijperi]|uniref:chitin synthase n=1 Tax=Wickerhamomyces pijperi TaxID=599730 RepID=A0A9P8QA92_WICPI|nr:hypothetical protein WICPIJ_003268 [Wickerhamomyces pijperi]